MALPEGLYDQPLDRKTRAILEAHPELRAVIKKIDADESPSRFAGFLARVIEAALRLEESKEKRRVLANHLLSEICKDERAAHLASKELVEQDSKDLLTEITPAYVGAGNLPRPITPIWESSLFTGATSDPQLDHELVQEIQSADRVDFLVAFIRWSGLRLLMPALEEAENRGIPIRVITTSYMGASEAQAVERLARFSNVEIRVSYDSDRTRLHAKAYHFHRDTSFSTAYIGSANVSKPALTSGLEWTLKVTNQDLPHILDKFQAEFETYWNAPEFALFDPEHPERFRAAIQAGKSAQRPGSSLTTFFAELEPRHFQEQILETLQRERTIHGQHRNLVIAATGTGKTVIAAFDYRRFRTQATKAGTTARLLFVAHRQEILEQSIGCFRAVLRDANFGDLHVGPHTAASYDHLFCSNLSLRNLQLWETLGPDYFDFIVVDEVHHSSADTYRDIFEKFSPRILLGLTATPERMDGQDIRPDFGDRFAAELRLPDALEEKLLCPFHYFAVSDPVSLDDQRFWRAGKYDVNALENVYTGEDILARQRVDAVLQALDRYHGGPRDARAVGFCVSIRHAEAMADWFNQAGLPSRALTSKAGADERTEIVQNFRNGEFPFLFVVDIFNEGVDIPEIDTVLFLRPTESLTIFLQQLGRGLRHAPEKECLTVIDLVGQMHRRYRIDRKFASLLPTRRYRIDREVEADFPHLPPGCSVILEKQARRHVLENIRRHYTNLQVAVTESLRTFEHDTGIPLTFGNFVRETGYEPHQLLIKKTWSEWKHGAGLDERPPSPKPGEYRYGITRTSLLSAPRFLETVHDFASGQRDIDEFTDREKLRIHYLVRQKSGRDEPHTSVEESLYDLQGNAGLLEDLGEVSHWAKEQVACPSESPPGSPDEDLELHGTYTPFDINVIFGKANYASPGQIGTGVVHFEDHKCYALLMTFRKSENEFSPSTMYEDYPISRSRVHWQSQNNTIPESPTGQRLTKHHLLGYTILIFARAVKKEFNATIPFTYLGPGKIVEHHGSRPITCLWDLSCPMPFDLYERSKVGG